MTDSVFSARALEALSDHVQLEVIASNTYLFFAHACYYRNLDAYGNLFVKWAKEEFEHAREMLKYLGDVGQCTPPDTSFSIKNLSELSLVDMLKASLELERHVGRSIYRVYKLALSEGDAGLVEFMAPFARHVPEELNEKETHMKRVQELGERLANDLLVEFLEGLEEVEDEED